MRRDQLLAGTVLVNGQTQERIVGDSKQVERSLTLRLTAGVPSADLNVSVDSAEIASSVSGRPCARPGGLVRASGRLAEGPASGN
jgi:hypothetical protein